MGQGQVLQVFSDAIMVAFKLAGPLLLVSVLIGLIIAIFQAATQIHEQTLTFVPKVLVLSLLLIFMGSWMIGTFTDFFNRLFLLMMSI